MKASGLIVLVLAAFGAIGYSSYENSMQTERFNQGVTRHLERAANAATVEIASSEINSALAFITNEPRLRQKLLSEKETDSDFSAWYQNLEGIQKTLEQVKSPKDTISDKQLVLNRISCSLVSEDWLGREIVKLTLNADVPSDSVWQIISFIGVFTIALLIVVPFLCNLSRW